VQTSREIPITLWFKAIAKSTLRWLPLGKSLEKFIVCNLRDVLVSFSISVKSIEYLEIKTRSFAQDLLITSAGAEIKCTFAASTVKREMDALKRFVDAAWAAKKAIDEAPVNTAAQVSAADELKKFKELLDMGVINQEEFDAKKKQLLGL
jgi:hypothetical protein